MRIFLVYGMALLFAAVDLYLIIQNMKKKESGFLVGNIGGAVFIAVLLFFYNALGMNPILFAGLILVLLGHIYVGEFLDFYHRSKRYDRYLHAFGTFICAWFVYLLIDRAFSTPVLPKGYTGIYIACVGVTLGVLCELLEWIIDFASKSRRANKNQHGLADTDFDLFADVIGAIAAGFLSLLFV